MPSGDSLRDLVRSLLRETLEQELRDLPGHVPAVTVATYANLWLAQRRQLKLVSVDDDETRLRLHVLPFCGQVRMPEFRPRNARELILHHRIEAKLSPRSILRVWAVVSTMFRSAVAEEVISSNPCVLARGVLPPNIDRDPAWRAGAVYTKQEVEALIGDDRLPLQRRVLYALKALAALRHKESARLRWSQIEAREPLAAIVLSITKTKRQRQVPVHPTLSWVLSEWRLRGWPRLFGRYPGPDDLVVPNLAGSPTEAANAQHHLLHDLKRLGMRRRRGHDLRRTFVTLTRAAGARDEVLRCITHGPKPDILEVYTSWPWATLCEAVVRLPVAIETALQLDLPYVNPPTERQVLAPKSVSPARIERATNGLKASRLPLLDDTSSSGVARGRG